jgi:hypothetical protein
MLRINFIDQNNPSDPGQQSDELTQEIDAGIYNLDIELDAAQLGLGPYGKKVAASSCGNAVIFRSLTLRDRKAIPPTTCSPPRSVRASAVHLILGLVY